MARRMPRSRRLPRILLNAATSVSLVLCVAMVVEWVRSYSRTTSFERDARAYNGAEAYTWRCVLRPGRLTLSYGMRSRGGPAAVIYDATDEDAARYDPGLDVGTTHLGFGAEWWHSPPEMADQFNRAVSIPYWALAIFCAVGPIWSLRRRISRRVDDRVLCPACGYDLRATPDSCPECGTVPAAGPST
jgi:hypothetical protein